MGVKVRERPEGSGVYWVFIDHQGKRRAKKIGRDRKTAIAVGKKIEAKLALGEMGVLEKREPSTTFKQYAEEWLEGFAKTALKESTYRGYRSVLDKHLEPAFGKMPLNEITRGDVKAFIFQKIKGGMSVSRAKRIKATLSGIFSHAVEDGLIQSNPSAKLDKLLKAKDQHLDAAYPPYTAEEIEIYLDAVRNNYPEHFPLFLTLARAGLRLGEALGLQWGDIDFQGGFIEIRRAWVNNRQTTTKTGKTRRVDATPQLLATLGALSQRRKAQTLRNGWGVVPEWVFVNEDGKPLDPGNLRGRVHYKACEKAKLRRVRIHDIRHSYATIRISAGHNIADVSRQLGHASIKITVDTYYHWLPSQHTGQVAELDEIGKIRNNPQPIRNQKEQGATT
jgi:integrase